MKMEEVVLSFRAGNSQKVAHALAAFMASGRMQEAFSMATLDGRVYIRPEGKLTEELFSPTRRSGRYILTGTGDISPECLFDSAIRAARACGFSVKEHTRITGKPHLPDGLSFHFPSWIGEKIIRPTVH